MVPGSADARAAGTPSLLTHAWILRCPASRAQDKPSPVMGEWAKAFPEGMPIGLEYLVLEALNRMARAWPGVCASRVAATSWFPTPTRR